MLMPASSLSLCLPLSWVPVRACLEHYNSLLTFHPTCPLFCPPFWPREDVLTHSSDPMLLLPHDPPLPRHKSHTHRGFTSASLAGQSSALWRISPLPVLAVGLGRTVSAPSILGLTCSFLGFQCRL